MHKDYKYPAHKQCDAKHQERPHLSPALMAMAKRDMDEFKTQSDEAFLIRAEMDKKLSSL